MRRIAASSRSRQPAPPMLFSLDRQERAIRGRMRRACAETFDPVEGTVGASRQATSVKGRGTRPRLEIVIDPPAVRKSPTGWEATVAAASGKMSGPCPRFRRQPHSTRRASRPFKEPARDSAILRVGYCWRTGDDTATAPGLEDVVEICDGTKALPIVPCSNREVRTNLWKWPLSHPDRPGAIEWRCRS